MSPSLLLLLLAADPAPEPTAAVAAPLPPARLLRTEVTAGVGLLGSAYASPAARWGDLHLAPVVTGRVLLGGFTTEAGVLLAVPFEAATTGTALTAGLAVGWSGERWSLTAGALLQWADAARPAVQVLPQLRAAYDFGPVGLSLGVFDQLGLIPAHLSAFTHLGPTRLSLGWVAPLGLLAGADLELPRGFGLRVTGFLFKLAQSEFAMLTIAGTFGGGAR